MLLFDDLRRGVSEDLILVSLCCRSSYFCAVYVFRHDLRTWGVIFENKVSNLCRIVVVAVATKSVCSHITNPRVSTKAQAMR